MLKPRNLCATAFALAILAAVCATAPGRLGSPRAASELSVPPPPAELRDRFGIYNWNVDDSAYPNGSDAAPDRLNWGADLVAQTGSRTIHVYLGARDVYRVIPPGAVTLPEIAASPAYDRLFRDPRFRTYLLTVYSRGANASDWADGFTRVEYQAERDEMARLGEYLLGNPNFAGKTFILLSWEGDNALVAVADKQTAWDNYRDWIQARADGVQLARERHPENPTRLFSGLEYNRVERNGAPCGSPAADPTRSDPLGHRCVIDYIAPRVSVDYFAYSAWQSLEVKERNPEASLKDRLKTDFNFALNLVKAQRPEITPANFILGEYGFDRYNYGECLAANYLNELFDAVTTAGAFQVSYAVWWQIADDNPSFWGNRGLFTPLDGKMRPTLSAITFGKRLGSQPATIYRGCPVLRRPPPNWGVVDSVTGSYLINLNPDGRLSITPQDAAATPFSPTGNLVHFHQGRRKYVLPRDNPTAFSESAGNIQVSLPAGRRPGLSVVHVTADGPLGRVDSNGQVVTLECANCPRFRPSCTMLDGETQMPMGRPGKEVSIYGSLFAPKGNTVVIEQLDAENSLRRYELSGNQLSFESPTRIDTRLPAALLADREAFIYVVDASGRETEEQMFDPTRVSLDCGPQINVCQALATGAGGELHPGTVISIPGQFRPNGNRVVVEQYDGQAKLSRYTFAAGSAQWQESELRIRVSLPTTLSAGRALVYVIDAAGRESTAREMTITPTTMINLSAASFGGAPLARESIVAAFGNALAISTQSVEALPLPDSLAGTRVLVKDSAGMERWAPLFFVSTGQVNYQIPLGTATGRASVTITSGDGSVTRGEVELVDVAPGLFAADANGQGLASAVALRVTADGTQSYEPIAVYDPAQVRYLARWLDLGPETDQLYLVVFGTGWRFRSSVEAVGAMIGGVKVPALYAGPQPYFAGLDQINLLLPRNLAGRGQVDVAVTADGKATNLVQVRFK